jgi:hypothetical protein
MVVWAWVGPDELGRAPGLGIKQALCPAGMIPMVSCREGAIEQQSILEQMQALATAHGNTIRLVRFVAEQVLRELIP